MGYKEDNAIIKRELRNQCIEGRISIKRSRGSSFITISTNEKIPATTAAYIEGKLVAYGIASTYIGDYTPSLQPENPCISWEVR